MTALTNLLTLVLLTVFLVTSSYAAPHGTHQAAEPKAAAEVAKTVIVQTFENKGIKVEFSISQNSSEDTGTAGLQEAQIADISFKITDAVSGAPVSPLEPAVWINLDKGSASLDDLSCKEKVSLYLQGTLGFQADIDLNKFYMLVMNNDSSISVVDPILGVSGITQLYGMIMLKDRGEDWAMGHNEKYLYVSMPRSKMVAVVDLETFKVIKNIEAGDNPTRLAMQADGRYLWVGNNSKDENLTGVTVIDTQKLETVKFIPTGPGHHELAFSEDSRTAYVTSSGSSQLIILDTQNLTKIKTIEVGERPIAVTFSKLSQAVYVASEEEGRISVIDAVSHRVIKQISTAPGLIALRFAPGDRWGFAVNLKQDSVQVIDASDNSITHNFKVGKQPHQVSFTASYAYIRALGASEMQLILLSQLDKMTSFDPQTIPLGNRPPNEYPYLAVADAISATGEWDTVLAASPADKTVYYYMEGMVAPMGTFPTYGRVPRAVRVIDRSLRETEKGVYSTKLRIPKSGSYDVAFLVDSPWVYNCFSFSATPDPVLAVARQNAPPKIEILNKDRTLSVGKEYKLRFNLTRQGTEPLKNLKDVSILASRPPGNWQNRQQARALDDGSYEVPLVADKAGVYYIYFAVPSMGIDYSRLPYLVLKADTALGG